MRVAVILVAMLSVVGARAEPAASPRAAIEAALKTAGCNQPLVLSLNNVTYHELGAGFSLAMVPCWGGAFKEAHMLFVVAPKSGGMPQLVRLQEWMGKAFETVPVVWMALYDSEKKVLTSFNKGRGRGDCGTAGEWTWTGSEFRMVGYWHKPNCDGEDFDRDDKFRVFPQPK